MTCGFGDEIFNVSKSSLGNMLDSKNISTAGKIITFEKNHKIIILSSFTLVPFGYVSAGKINIFLNCSRLSITLNNIKLITTREYLEI